MAHPRSGHAPRTKQFLAFWLLTLVLVATQVAAPVALAAPTASTGKAAPVVAAPTTTVKLHVFAARDEAFADIGPVSQGDAVDMYKWMINEDNTGSNAQRNANPGSGCSPADAGYPGSCAWTSIAGLRSSAPVVAQGDETTLDLDTGITLPAGRYLISVLADGYKLDGTPFTIPADPGTIEVPLQPLPLPTATATAEVFADVTSANGQYDPGEDGVSGFTGKLADYLGQVNTDVFGNPLCTTYKAGTGPNGYEWVDGGPVVLHQGGKCLSGDADMDGVVEGSVGGDDYTLWQASADPAIAAGLLRIPNLGPNRYAMSVVPPTGQSWIETTTLEGNHDWDTWLMEGSTGFDTEFVVAGEPFPATIFGYVPGPTSTYQVPTGSSSTYWQLPAHSFATSGPTGTIKGVVRGMKVYVPATGGTCLPGTIWGGLCGGKVDPAPIKDAWIALSDLNRGDTAVKLVRANSDGSFTITGVPVGSYTLTYWDEKQNYILDLVQVVVAAGETEDLGILPLAGWFTKIDGYVFNDRNRNGTKDASEPGIPNFGLTLRKRENSLMDRGSTAVSTDAFGYYVLENAYPLTEWLVLEAYNDSFYTTGVTYQADNQPEPTTILGAGVDVSVLPIIGLAGRIDWGVHSYDALGTTNGVDPQNGGIVGSISYDTTRNELDPQYAAAEDWQPGVSGLTVQLYGTVPCGTHVGTPCDVRGDYELAPDGSYAYGKPLNTYVSETWERPTSGETGEDCLARDVNGTPLVYPTDQQVLPVGPNKGCLEGPLMGVQFGTYPTDQGTPDANFGAAVDGNYGFGDGCFDGTLVVIDPSAPLCASTTGSVTGPVLAQGSATPTVLSDGSVTAAVLAEGIATADDPDGQVLTDSAAQFITVGIGAGDVVEDTTDGSTGTVATVDSETQITLAGTGLAGGSGAFTTGDAYRVVAAASVTELQDSAATFLADGVSTGDQVTNLTDGSSGTVATVDSETQLTLSGPLTGGTADSFATGDVYRILAAAASATILTDATATFIADGVSPGDTVENTTDGSTGEVATVDSDTQLTLTAALTGGTANTFATGDDYRVIAATATASATILTDATATFIADGVSPGDPVWNITDGSTGEVATVDSGTQLTLASALAGGSANTFAGGDAYAVGEVPFGALTADAYLVHIDLGSKTDANGDPIYKVTREEDINIGNGDTFVPQVPPPACAGALHQVDVAGDGTDGYDPIALPDPSGNGGSDLLVPGSTATPNPTFVDIGASPYESTARPLCDTKLVDLQDGKSIVPMFNVFTDVPLPGRFFFYNVDDLNFSTDPKSILYGEKAGMAFNPVGVYDWANRLVTTVETDYNGLADVLLPSTNRINCPTPSGVCANLYRFVGNDPGVPGRLNLNYNPQYRTIAAEFEALPGLIVPADTAPTQLGVNAQLPGAQFNGPLVCRMNEPGNPTVPELYAVSRPYVTGGGSRTFSIDGQGFGSATGTVTLDGIAVPTTSWNDGHIGVSVPASTLVGPHQLAIRSASGAATVNGLTFHVLGYDPFPDNGVLDNFDRTGFGGDWQAATVFSLSSNNVRVTGTGTMRWGGTAGGGPVYGAAQEAFFTFVKVSPTATEQGLFLKVTGSGTNPNPTDTSAANIEVSYKATAPSSVQVRTKNSGTGTVVPQATWPASFAANDQLGARALPDGTVIAYKNGVEINRVTIPTSGPGSWANASGGGRLGIRFVGAQNNTTNDARFDNFGGGSITIYTPNLYEVGPGLNGPNQFPAVQYEEGNPPHPVQDALDAAAASPGNDLVVVYPGLATPSNPRLNPRGAYYENLIVHSPVKLQGVGPGSADGVIQGSVIDGSAFGGDTALAENWRVAVDALTRAGNQTVYEGPTVSVFAATTSQYGSAFRAGIDGFDVRGGDQSNFPQNINEIGGGPTGLPPNVVTQGGGIFVNAYARYLQITNNVIESNSGSYAGGIRVGTPNLPQPDTSQHNENIRIANNRVVTNGGTNLAGGIGLFAGSDGYAVTRNDICGNSSAEYGGGVSVYGYSPSGSIDHNRIWFNSSYDEGAGIMIAGELPADPSILSPGSGPVDIHDNLVQANIANDDGGGIRFLMAGNFPMNVFNNMIVNNVSTHEGGGIAIDDAPDVRVYANTIMKNITTATAVTSTGEAAPAGLSTGANSALLQATGVPAFTPPLLFNNIFWDNRAGTRDLSTVTGLGLTADVLPIDHWDLGTGDGSGSLAPTNSIVQQHPGDHVYTVSPTNSGADPSVASPFDLSVAFSPWRTNPNFVGALLVAVDAPAGTLGDYHIPGTSPAVDTGASSKGGVSAPAWDIDNDGRPNGSGHDIGADERAGTAAPAPAPAPVAFPQAGVLDAFNRANGALGGNWGGTTSQAIYRIDGNNVQVRATGDRWWNATGSTFGANQEAYLTFADVASTGATKQGLILKRTGNGSSLIEVVYNVGTGRVDVRTASGGVLTDRASIPAVFWAGDQLGARALADGTIAVYRNGVQLGSTSVPALAWAGATSGGQVGLRFDGATTANDARFDDFGGGTLP